jgi:hypothetical protein
MLLYPGRLCGDRAFAAGKPLAPRTSGAATAAETVFSHAAAPGRRFRRAASSPVRPCNSSKGVCAIWKGLAAAASAINATLDLPTVLQVLVERAATLLGVPGAAVIW